MTGYGEVVDDDEPLDVLDDETEVVVRRTVVFVVERDVVVDVELGSVVLVDGGSAGVPWTTLFNGPWSDAARSGVTNGLAGLPGWDPPNPITTATATAAPAATSVATDSLATVARSRWSSVRRRRSSCAESSECWFNHDMNGALA